MNELKVFAPAPTKKEVRAIMSKVRRLFNFYRFGELYGLEPAEKVHEDIVIEPISSGKICYYDWLSSYRKIGNDFQLSDGATKIVFVPSDEKCRWVVKLPIPDSSKDDYWYTEEEANIFKEAKNENLSRFFAATYLIGSFKGIPIVLQQRLSVSESDVSSIFVNYSYENGIIHNPCERCEYADCGRYNPSCSMCACCEDAPCDDDAEDLDDVDRLQAIFGWDYERIYEFLERFCEKNKTCMDLHSGNYGYTKNTGELVIMDFCGY